MNPGWKLDFHDIAQGGDGGFVRLPVLPNPGVIFPAMERNGKIQTTTRSKNPTGFPKGLYIVRNMFQNIIGYN